jgi:hypothetical protein
MKFLVEIDDEILNRHYNKFDKLDSCDCVHNAIARHFRPELVELGKLSYDAIKVTEVEDATDKA